MQVEKWWWRKYKDTRVFIIDLICIDLLALAEKANKAGTGTKKKSKKDKSATPNNTGANSNVFTEKHFNPNENFSYYLRDHKHKKGVVITWRVHPGESNSSFVAGKLLLN